MTHDLPLGLHITRPVSSDGHAIASLVSAVVRARPAYAPTVIAGIESLQDWWDKKELSWRRVAWVGDVIVGHVGVRKHRLVPGGVSLPEERTHELARLAVHPEWQGRGIAPLLISATTGSFPGALWATTHAEGGAARIFKRLDWTHHSHEVSWADDPEPGVALLSPSVTQV